MHADSTMAVEVALSEALVSWPYFQDLSLVGWEGEGEREGWRACAGVLAESAAGVCCGGHAAGWAGLACALCPHPRPTIQPRHPQVWSISNIFSAPGSPQRPPGERDNLAPPRRPPPAVLATGPSAWLYFNLLVSQSQVCVGRSRGCRLAVPSLGRAALPTLAHHIRATWCPPCPQIFVPVYDVAAAQELAAALWSGSDVWASKSGFEQVADMALACAVLGEVDTDGGCTVVGGRHAAEWAPFAEDCPTQQCRTSSPRPCHRPTHPPCRHAPGAGGPRPRAVGHRAALCLLVGRRRREQHTCGPAGHRRFCAGPRGTRQLRHAALLSQDRHGHEGGWVGVGAKCGGAVVGWR